MSLGASEVGRRLPPLTAATLLLICRRMVTLTRALTRIHSALGAPTEFDSRFDLLNIAARCAASVSSLVANDVHTFPDDCIWDDGEWVKLFSGVSMVVDVINRTTALWQRCCAGEIPRPVDWPDVLEDLFHKAAMISPSYSKLEFADVESPAVAEVLSRCGESVP